MSMIRWDRLSRLALVLVIPFGVAACNSDKIYTVPASGTVTYKGKPLEKGQVQFLPTEGPAAVGLIENGKFVLGTNNVGNGAPPGKYRVTVFSYTNVQSKFGEITSKSVIPNRYTNPDSSGIVEDIPEGGNNAIDIKLKD
jgi:hypothetical protein